MSARELLNILAPSARALIRQADTARDQGRWADAVRLYEKAIEIDPRPGLWVQLGHVRKESGSFQEAEAAYLQARRLRPDDMDVALQLGHLYKARNDRTAAVTHYRIAIEGGLNDVHALHFLEQPEDVPEPKTSQPTVEPAVNTPPDPIASTPDLAIYLDCSDLLLYFAGNRFPTGIQRVQIELFKASVAWTGSAPITACAWSETAGFWAALDPVTFTDLCSLASETGGDGMEDRWRVAVDGVRRRLLEGKALSFPAGAVLINLGASWWMADYMAGVRQAKARYGVRYVPLLYDLIPLITPEHCAAGLQSAFAAWASSVFMHADLVGAISERTRQDVVRHAAAVKPLSLEPVVMPLDARFGLAAGLDQQGRQAVLEEFGLEPGGFVLVVGTLEVRKNHQLLFEGWNRLMGSENADQLPMLVCVGKQGYRYDLLQGYLDSHPALAEKVLLLLGISDAQLDTLYAECLFTAYSSFYEGWGLPVTESLCHGKVCLCADHSSLPEAGGRFAVYYSVDSVRDFAEKARQLIFDPAARTVKEAEIVADFRPRGWDEVLDSFVGQVLSRFRPAAVAPPLWAEIAFGTIYHTRRRPELPQLDRDTATAEMLRLGASWYSLEDWGMWARERRAKLLFKMSEFAGTAEDLLLYLRVNCSPIRPLRCTIRLGGVRLGEAVIEPGMIRTVQLRIPASAVKPGELGAYVLELETDALVDLKPLNELDERRVGVGLTSLMVCRLGDVAARLDIAEREVMLVPD